MFRGVPSELTEAEEEALAAEVGRIAQMGGAWSPTEEALREVFLAVKAAGSAEHRAKQRRGIAQAREAGVRLGRPRKERPSNFDSILELEAQGEITQRAAARMCGVSAETFRRWRKERDAAREAQGGPARG